MSHLETAVADIVPALQELQAAEPGRRVRSLEVRVDEIEHGLRVHNGLLEQFERHLPSLLNAIASYAGASRRINRRLDEIARSDNSRDGVLTDHATAINDLWGRVEVIRKELMLELRYSGTRTAAAAPLAEPKVLDEERLAAATAEGLRVNLGCGHIPLPEYINVDMREMPGVDVLATVDNLPFEPGELVELFSAHLVEHFPEEQFVREVLPYWVSLVRPGGTLRAVLPDAGAMLAGFTEGTIPYADLREVLYGGQEYEGDFHFNMYTAESLAEILRDAGLVDVVVEDEGRRNGACLEMQISARVPD